MSRHRHVARFALAIIVALAHVHLEALAAETPPLYQIQVIARTEDRVGDLKIKTTSVGLSLGTLNDKGQLVFVAENSAGGMILLQYNDGSLTPIAVAGQDGPIGTWPASLLFRGPVSMNQAGSVVFSAVTSDSVGLGTFLWDASTKKVASVAVAGMPAGTEWIFTPARDGTPLLNNKGDIAFSIGLKATDGSVGQGVFLRGRSGELQPVAVPGQSLGGGEVHDAVVGGISDAGLVAFRASTEPNGPTSGYLWEDGSITPIARVRGDVPGAEKVDDVTGIWLNNKNRSLLARIRIEGHDTDSLYRWEDGQLSPLLVPGQEMPGGGTLKQLESDISSASEAGQHAIVGTVDDGGSSRTGVYLLDADGKMSLVLQVGAVTPQGPITHLASSVATPSLYGIGLNGPGQLALPVRFDNGPPVVALLTPSTP